MIAAIAFGAFGLTFVAAGIRAIRGPGIADRVAALDVAVISLMGGVAVETARTGSTVLLPIVAVLAIVGFTATVAASRFIERYGEASS